MAQDPYKYFRPEAQEILDRFSRGILDLEKGEASADGVQQLLRLAHTLKGAARVVRQPEIANRAHAIEDALSPLRDSANPPHRAQIDTVLTHLDFISTRLDSLGPQPEPERTARPEEPPRTVRTDLAETDAVLEGVGEAHAVTAALRAVSQETRRAVDLADLLVSQNPAVIVAENLRRKIMGIERGLGTALEQMDRELRQLREAAERLRLVPAKVLFTTLERAARDTALALSRQATFTATGGDIRLDAHVLDMLQGALVQIVRNAVSHGLEPEDERSRAGKDPLGKIAVSISRRDRWVVFSCTDDGRGVNFAAVTRAASERGIADIAGRQLDRDEIMRVLLQGGISTSETVTQEAGRGIGLDIVREAAERLGGKVDCHSTPGVGTTFDIVIPPTLSSMDVLIAQATSDESPVAIPLDAVRRTRRLAPDEIMVAASGTSTLHDGNAIPYIPLTVAFGGALGPVERNSAVVIVAAADGLAAIGVAHLLGTARIVVRPLPQRMTAGPAVMAASLDADGVPQLVLDPDGLVAAAREGRARDTDVAPARRPVLIVDDSLTTRMLEQSILESAGYDVDVAESGEEALDRLRSRDYALILVDVEMPGMDGFTFIEHLRADAKSRHIPAILVTSLAEPEHRKRGRAVGAQGYIVKSEFDQAELLSMIKPMMAA
jgi:two-component system chemotaxis sensor kinase CheA